MRTHEDAVLWLDELAQYAHLDRAERSHFVARAACCARRVSRQARLDTGDLWCARRDDAEGCSEQEDEVGPRQVEGKLSSSTSAGDSKRS